MQSNDYYGIQIVSGIRYYASPDHNGRAIDIDEIVNIFSTLHRHSLLLGCVFLGESKKGFVISDPTDSSLPKKRKIRKRIIYHDNGMSSCSSWKKRQQDKKKKQHKLGVNIPNVAPIEYTPYDSKIIRILN